MLPEISRRCLSCGAAVRAGARFCPQCGQEMADAGGVAPAEAAPPARDFEPERDAGPPRPTAEQQPPPRVSQTTQDWTPPTKEYAAFVESVGGGARGEVEAPRGEVEAPPAGDAADGASAPDGASEGARGAGRVARVRGEARARVGRMRDEAIVVLEETPDDSGLRFVVAAAALFLVFVFLLFLSIYVLR